MRKNEERFNMNKKYKTISVSTEAHNRLKKLSSVIFESPLSLAKTIDWLLEKQDKRHNEERKKS